MTTAETDAIQGLLDQIGTLQDAIRTAGDDGRTKLKGIKTDEVRGAVPRVGGKLDVAAWSARPEKERKDLRDQLVQVRDSLRAAAVLDGPSDPGHVMSTSYASSLSVVLWTLFSFLLVGFLLGAVITRWDRATSTDFASRIEASVKTLKRVDAAREAATRAGAALGEAAEAVRSAGDTRRRRVGPGLETLSREAAARRAEAERIAGEAGAMAVDAIRSIQSGGASEGTILLMVTLLGALGGSLHLVGSLVKYVGNRQLRRSWLPYYLSLPIVGAALAPIIYMLLRVGLLSPSNGVGQGLRVSDLNLTAIYAFAAMSGMFAKTATDKLCEVFATIFRTARVTSRDPIGSEISPGASASAASRTS